MKKLLLLLLCTCMQAAFAQSGKIDWKADLEFLTKELPEKHCNFFTARSKGEFVSGIEAIKAESERLTDFQVALKNATADRPLRRLTHHAAILSVD